MTRTCRFLTLNDLPPPPTGRTGFPWTEQSFPPSSYASDLSIYPRISIITPTYNQGHFIEETIRSVLLQSYCHVEYIVIDGGSTDNTVEVIKKYEPWIHYWVSEPDRGQAHAINKGIRKATGAILAYLNSDDYYLPDTLFKVATHFQNYPSTTLMHGKCRYVDVYGQKIGEQLGHITSFSEILDLWDVWWKNRQFVQPEVFWKREITEQIGLFNENLYFALDYEYWCRIIRIADKIKAIDSELSCFRFTNLQKSNHSDLVAQELLAVVQPLLWDFSLPLSTWPRLLLQGKWLYQMVFLEEVSKSIHMGEHKLIRWAKLFKTICRNPQILLAPELHRRIKKSMCNS